MALPFLPSCHNPAPCCTAPEASGHIQGSLLTISVSLAPRLPLWAYSAPFHSIPTLLSGRWGANENPQGAHSGGREKKWWVTTTTTPPPHYSVLGVCQQELRPPHSAGRNLSFLVHGLGNQLGPRTNRESQDHTERDMLPRCQKGLIQGRLQSQWRLPGVGWRRQWLFRVFHGLGHAGGLCTTI